MHAPHTSRNLGPPDGPEDSRHRARRDSPHRLPTVRKALAMSRRLSPRHAEIRLPHAVPHPDRLGAQPFEQAFVVRGVGEHAQDFDHDDQERAVHSDGVALLYARLAHRRIEGKRIRTGVGCQQQIGSDGCRHKAHTQ